MDTSGGHGGNDSAVTCGAAPDVDDYAHLWNGSESGWALQVTSYQVWTFAVVFRYEPTVEQIRATRELLPYLHELGAHDAFRLLRDSCRVEVPGPLSSITAHELAQRAAQRGLDVEMHAIDRSSSIPVRNGVAFVIEDDDVAHEVCKRMIEAGIPVTYAEAD